MLMGSWIEMSKIMVVQQQLMPGLDDQEMREPVQAPIWWPSGLSYRYSSLQEKFTGCGVINFIVATSGFPYVLSLSPEGVLEDEGEWLKKVGTVYKEREMCYESGGGGRSGIGPFPWIFSKPDFSQEFKMHCKSGEGGIFDIGGMPSWTISTIENMKPGFNGEFEMGNKSGGRGMFKIVGIPSGEVTGVLDPFLDHKGNDHVVYIHGDPDVNNANGFVSHGYKNPQAARFIAKAGAVAGAWGMILGMATYLPQEIQWIAAVAAAIPTLAVIFA